MLAIPKQSKNQELAWKFVEFAALSRDSQLFMFKTANLFPSLETAYDDPFFDEPDAYYSDQAINRTFADIAGGDIPMYYYTPYFGELDDLVRDTAYQYFRQQISLDEALETMQSRGEAIKNRYEGN